jgi:hypothetical protein
MNERGPERERPPLRPDVSPRAAASSRARLD